MSEITTPTAEHLEAIRALASEPSTPAEDRAMVQALLIGHRHRHPYYKHIIRRFEPQRARKRLASLQDGGKRLLKYVQDAGVELKDTKSFISRICFGS